MAYWAPELVNLSTHQQLAPDMSDAALAETFAGRLGKRAVERCGNGDDGMEAELEDWASAQQSALPLTVAPSETRECRELQYVSIYPPEDDFERHVGSRWSEIADRDDDAGFRSPGG